MIRKVRDLSEQLALVRISAQPMFTAQTAHEKVKKAQNLWNTKSPSEVVKAYSETSTWRNRDQFLSGHEEIAAFLSSKWQREEHYILRKELFAFTENRIAVQFWYEYKLMSSASSTTTSTTTDGTGWRRCYGLEHWVFAADGRMMSRMMSGNEIAIKENERWFKCSATDVDLVDIPEGHKSPLLL